jgi:hypothetical protein
MKEICTWAELCAPHLQTFHAKPNMKQKNTLLLLVVSDPKESRDVI